MSRTVRTLDRAGAPNAQKEVEITDSPQDSIELSVNAKGEPSWSIKAYGVHADEIAERLIALRKIAETHAAEIRSAKGA